ncbi:MAG TPA: DNA polymerase III subunit delta [Sphingomonas sp.]
MKANAGQIRTALGKRDPGVRLFLLHGPDAAGAGELANVLARAMGADAERVDLDGSTLKSDPARLADEAASMSLFGGARFIRVSGVGEESHDALEALLEGTTPGNPVVAIAPTVKTSAKIVKLAIAHRAAMAFACYAPTGQDADRMATGISAEHGMRLAAGVARRLVEAAGGDRAVLTREIEKFALYLDAAPERPAELDHAAVDAIGADLADAEMGGAVDAIIRGDPAALGAEIAALDQADISPIAWLRATGRRLVMLAEIRAAVDEGEPVDRVLGRHRVHFKEEAAVTAAARRWTPVMLAAALDRVRQAERATMAPGNAGPVLAAAAVTAIARGVARRG